MARRGYATIAALDSAPAPRLRPQLSTLRRYARAAGYTWKRCRRSLRPQRDPAAFAAAQAHLFVLAVHEFCQTLTRPTVLVLDNASIHKAHVVRACHAEWAAKGLTLVFLPPYSPELNKIELLWHRCKHYWVRPEDYQTDQTLLERVEYVLSRGGSDYTITFA